MLNRIRLIVALILAMQSSASAFAEDYWLAVGHGGERMLSTDGKTWMQVGSWSKPAHNQDDLNVAANFKGAFYVGGGYYSGRLVASRDGKNWSDGVIPGSSPIFGLEVMGDSLFAMDLRGKVFKTVDGEKWQLVATPTMPAPTEAMRKFALERSKGKPVTDAQAQGHWIRGTAQGNGLILGSGDYGPVVAFNPKTNETIVTKMAGQDTKNPGPKRVAFGNGVFVVVGEKGLIARTRDGKMWENNRTRDDVGDVQCVEFNGKEFLLTHIDTKAKKSSVMRSTDGLAWERIGWPVPRHVRLVNGVLYSSSYPPTKLARSQDGGRTWEQLANNEGWHFKAYAFGPLAGGAPPRAPSK
ncbi:MAG TPA: hypothetical protein VFE62_17750 [Gemmataceae bacterium]|nr:hypothetical protein [Gemmataceae bacterium]